MMDYLIYTGNYYDCQSGNLISISGDRGKRANFIGKAIPELAPKRDFWEIWHSNIGVIPDEENAYYYIKNYYSQVLRKANIEELLRSEREPILLCYEKDQEFCHRHILAEYIELKYTTKVKEISISKSGKKIEKWRPFFYREMLIDVIRNSKF